MKIKERYNGVIKWFSENMKEPQSELNYMSPYQLLVAVILSAQCTDKRVNMVTPALFEAFPNPKSMAESNDREIFEYIKSISYPNNKAKNLHKMAIMLSEDFNSVVPDDVDQLQKLPGVGRKTANVVASVIYKKPAMAVDTHVFRVSNRIGLTTALNPVQSEKQLVKYIPPSLIPDAHHWLILHGRYVCTARKPDCEHCGISSFCKKFSTDEKNRIKILYIQ